MRILLGVTGGIAAYKACELVSLATKAGHELRVVMTAAGTRFVGPATFEALTDHPVMTDTFADALAHISWAKWADVGCIAPLSANTLGKLACGLADDALSTVFMAVPRGVPVVLAPAMNTEMWNHPAVHPLRSKRLAHWRRCSMRSSGRNLRVYTGSQVHGTSGLLSWQSVLSTS